MSLLRRVWRNLGKAARRPRWALGVARRLVPLRALSRDPEAYQHVSSWTFGKASRRELTDVFPGIEAAAVTITRAFDRDPGQSLNAAEALALAAIVSFRKPERILEIGTAQGNTTLNLAANAGETSRVTTIDLPPDWNQATDVPDALRNATGRPVGRQYLNSKFEKRIEQRFCDSFDLDWDTLPGPFDLVLIDGCHYYPYVQRDTANALRNVRSNGVILWHDYGIIDDVSRAVDEVADQVKVCAIRGTRFAVAIID